ncbi:MAG: ribonuclease H-like domain-containing protein [Nitrospirota bacterium]|nr:ribonuclease H-like domain-containing protein [Nitrospirota bacterium]
MSAPKKHLFVFDIETVPDLDAGRRLLDMQGAPDDEVDIALRAYHLEVTEGRNDFLRQPFWKVVAISYVQAQVERGGGSQAKGGGEVRFTLTRVGSGGDADSSEKDLVEGFFRHLEQKKPRLVSFNGRTFDLPVLKYRAMVHGLSAPHFFDTSNKWENYTQRYADAWHADLLETLSDYGASARVRLDEVSRTLSLPGKLGTSGGDVAPLFAAGRIDDIRNYCETDVVNTYLLFLRWELLRGTISPASHEASVLEMANYLETERAERPHLGEFLDAWRLMEHSA